MIFSGVVQRRRCHRVELEPSATRPGSSTHPRVAIRVAKRKKTSITLQKVSGTDQEFSKACEKFSVVRQKSSTAPPEFFVPPLDLFAPPPRFSITYPRFAVTSFDRHAAQLELRATKTSRRVSSLQRGLWLF
jgi:hypothetical protein